MRGSLSRLVSVKAVHRFWSRILCYEVDAIAKLLSFIESYEVG